MSRKDGSRVISLIPLLVLPWIFWITFRLFGFVWDLTAGSVFHSFGAAALRYQSWQSEKSIFEKAAEAIRNSPLRSQARSSTTHPEILELGALLQKAVGNCNALHHYAAEALSVENMKELEDHSICRSYRARVVEISDFILDRTVDVDVDDLTGAKMAIGLGRMREMCADCVLLRFPASHLPPLCAPAMHMGCTPESESKKGV